MLKRQKLFIIVLIGLFFNNIQLVVAYIPEFSSDVELYSKTSGTSMASLDLRNEARMKAERNENNRVKEFKNLSLLDKFKNLTTSKISLKEAWTGKPDAQKVALARSKAAFKATDFETRNKIFTQKPAESDAELFEMHMTPEEIKYEKETAAHEVRISRMEAERKKASEEAKRNEVKVKAEAESRAKAEAKFKAEAEARAKERKEAFKRAQEEVKKELEERRKKEAQFQKYLKENEPLFKILAIKELKEEINEKLSAIGFSPEFIASRGDKIPTESEMLTVYRKKLLQVHPDKGGSVAEAQKVNNAKDFLVNELSKKINDMISQIARNNFK